MWCRAEAIQKARDVCGLGRTGYSYCIGDQLELSKPLNGIKNRI